MASAELRSLRALVTGWTSVRLADTAVLPNFDLAPDGKRVIALLPAPESLESENHATFVLDFVDEVRRRAAVAK